MNDVSICNWNAFVIGNLKRESVNEFESSIWVMDWHSILLYSLFVTNVSNIENFQLFQYTLGVVLVEEPHPLLSYKWLRIERNHNHSN